MNLYVFLVLQGFLSLHLIVSAEEESLSTVSVVDITTEKESVNDENEQDKVVKEPENKLPTNEPEQENKEKNTPVEPDIKFAESVNENKAPNELEQENKVAQKPVATDTKIEESEQEKKTDSLSETDIKSAEPEPEKKLKLDNDEPQKENADIADEKSSGKPLSKSNGQKSENNTEEKVSEIENEENPNIVFPSNVPIGLDEFQKMISLMTTPSNQQELDAALEKKLQGEYGDHLDHNQENDNPTFVFPTKETKHKDNETLKIQTGTDIPEESKSQPEETQEKGSVKSEDKVQSKKLNEIAQEEQKISFLKEDEDSSERKIDAKTKENNGDNQLQLAKEDTALTNKKEHAEKSDSKKLEKDNSKVEKKPELKSFVLDETVDSKEKTPRVDKVTSLESENSKEELKKENKLPEIKKIIDNQKKTSDEIDNEKVHKKENGKEKIGKENVLPEIESFAVYPKTTIKEIYHKNEDSKERNQKENPLPKIETPVDNPKKTAVKINNENSHKQENNKENLGNAKMVPETKSAPVYPKKTIEEASHKIKNSAMHPKKTIKETSHKNENNEKKIEKKNSLLTIEKPVNKELRTKPNKSEQTENSLDKNNLKNTNAKNSKEIVDKKPFTGSKNTQTSKEDTQANLNAMPKSEFKSISDLHPSYTEEELYKMAVKFEKEAPQVSTTPLYSKIPTVASQQTHTTPKIEDDGTNVNTTLLFAEIVFRHGDRYKGDEEDETYPNDPYSVEDPFWLPYGQDQLRNKGKMRGYWMGLFLRKRYNGFLKQEYYHNDIRLTSADLNKCIDTAHVMTIGLYPPKGINIWNDNVGRYYQPIPVRTLDSEDDIYLNEAIACKPYEEELKRTLNEGMRNFNLKYKYVYEYLEMYTGMNVTNLQDVAQIYTALRIEHENGRVLPEWTGLVFPEKLKMLNSFYNQIRTTSTDYFKQLQAGPLLNRLMDEIHLKSINKLKPNYKIKFWSGFDTTILKLLYTIKETQPSLDKAEDLFETDYNGALIIELHVINKKQFIKVLYINMDNQLAQTKTPRLIKICDGKTLCPLNEFFDRMNKFRMTPEQWFTACKQPFCENIYSQQANIIQLIK